MTPPTKTDDRWVSFGVTTTDVERVAAQLSDSKTQVGRSAVFFEMAARLLGYARYDLLLVNVALFQCIPGLEQALKLHFNRHEDRPLLRDLLQKALAERLIHDGLFQQKPWSEPFREAVERWLAEAEIKVGFQRPKSYSETLVFVLIQLRNRYFHGEHYFMPDFLDLISQIQRITEVLYTVPWGRGPDGLKAK